MARPIDGKIVKEMKVDDEKLQAVPEFCYLGDMLSAGNSCELAAVTRCKCAWGKFPQLLPLLTNHNLPLLTRGVFIMRKECDAACSIDLGQESSYNEPPAA